MDTQSLVSDDAIFVFGPYIGHALLTEWRLQQKSTGEAYARLALDDANGTVTAFVWAEGLHRLLGLRLPALVQVSGLWKHRDTEQVLFIETLTAVAPAAVPRALALLPQRWCPPSARHALKALVALEAGWPAPLRGFVAEVLLDPAIGLPFLRAKASMAHHHSERGGLLRHSVELIDLVPALATTLLPEFPEATALAEVALLFHDLGKIVTVGEGDGMRPDRPTAYAGLGHEAITLRMLTPPLERLAEVDPDAAAVLRQTFSYLAQDPRSRGFAPNLIVEIVRFCDQMSTARDRGRGLGGRPAPALPRPS